MHPVALTLTAPRRVELVPETPGPVPPGHLRVRTLYSGISAGTELTLYRGTNPHLTRNWDPQRRLFGPTADGAPAGAAYPNAAWGYSEVGEVVELGPDVPAGAPAPGDLVWGMWGHRSEAVLPLATATGRVLPAGLDPVCGTFARVGAVALNAVLAADVHVGETVVVFGQGVLGLLATQLAALNGARVVAVDTIRARRDAALAHRAVLALDPGCDDVAGMVRGVTDGRGADVCIEISGAYPALQEATRTVAPGGRVVASGFYQGEGLGLRLGEEFHHNRVQLVSSQISAAPPALAQRWTPERIHRTVVELIAAAELDVLSTVSRIVPVTEAAQAYARLDADPAAELQVVLDFTGATSTRGAACG
jgi:2-desacetyl-2-hydroxyethyl bacteriochlorophyllide A dehydrogenase